MRRICALVRDATRQNTHHPLSRRGLLAAGFVAFLLTVGVGPSSSVEAQPAPVKASDLLQLQEIQHISISPSGRDIAYTVRRAASAQTGKEPVYETQLYVVPAGGREEPRLLTRSDASTAQPAWHPDGSQLAFVREVSGTPQLFVLSLSGGEAFQLTDTPHGATHPQWSPSGDRLLFATSLPEYAVRHRSRRPAPTVQPGRSPADTSRQVPPDTIVVLRHTETLSPVDTLSLPDSERTTALRDTARVLQVPDGEDVPPTLDTIRVDDLRSLAPDSVQRLFERLHLRADTTTVPPRPDTAASPDGDLVQLRRWMAQRKIQGQAEVVSRLHLEGPEGRTSPFRYRHYNVVDVPETITRGSPSPPAPQPVTRGYRSYQDAEWLPGGTQIIVSAPPSVEVTRNRNLYLVDLQPYRLHRLLSIEGHALTRPRPTADGTTIAFRMHNLSNWHYRQTEVGLFDLDGRSNPEMITQNFDRSISELRWSPDGWYLYVSTLSDGGRPLYRFAPFAREDTTSPRDRTSLTQDRATSQDQFALDSSMVRTATFDRMSDEAGVIQAFDATDSQVVYARATASNPSELYTNTISFQNERRLSEHNASWLASRDLAESEWRTVFVDDHSVMGRVTRPVHGADTARSPLVLRPRGGPPRVSSSSAAHSWFERQYLAARGYGIVEVWPRGSAGFGQKFRRKNFQDWGPGPARDVLAVLDTVANQGWVDPSQQTVVGHGYGGYLATWLIGHTDRFQAAVAQSGVYDLEATLEGGRLWSVLAEQFGGYSRIPTTAWETTLSLRPDPTPLLSVGVMPARHAPTTAQSALRWNSPVRYAHEIDTPLLLLHGTADRRSEPSQAEQLYRRLKLLGRSVEYVRYPGVGHDFSRSATPRQSVDRLVRTHEFMRRFTIPHGPGADRTEPAQ